MEINPEQHFSVYMHVFPDKRIYVGYTGNDPKRRWQSYNRCNKEMQGIVDSIGWQNIEHRVLYCGLTYEEACKKEEELIDALCLTDPHYGLNKLRGGDLKHAESPTTKKKKQRGHRCTPVVCIDTGIFYASAREAARAMSLDERNILHTCQGRVNRHGGYRFRYATEAEKAKYDSFNVVEDPEGGETTGADKGEKITDNG